MFKQLVLIFTFVLSLNQAQAAGALGVGAFSSKCEASRKSSDNCVDCNHMSSGSFQDHWLKPMASRDCRYRYISYRKNSSGTFDVIGVRNDTGREEVMSFTVVLSEIQADYRSREDLAQKDLETEDSELNKRAQYELWKGKIKVNSVIQAMKPVSPAMMVNVANVTITYSLRGLSADRIFTALDTINFVNANSPIGKLFKPIVDWAIGELGREARKTNACMLRMAKNQFTAMNVLSGTQHSDVKFFCLDNKKMACGDCFRSNNNLKDLAYQIVKPENGTMRAIRDGLMHIGETTALEWDDPVWGN